jgi:tetratricopeptide (TPR) repeat protein
MERCDTQSIVQADSGQPEVQQSEYQLALSMHCAHYIDLLGRDTQRFDSGAQLEAMRSTRMESNNIQIAQDRATVSLERPLLAVLVRSVHWLYVIALRDYMRGLAAAGRLTDACARLGDPALHSLALSAQARLRHVVGEIRAALADAQLARELAGTEPEVQASAEQVLGLVRFGLHELTAAEEHMQRALELYAQLGDLPRQAQMLNNLGLTAADQQDAVALFERSLQLARQQGHLWIEATVLSNLLGEALNVGALQRARQYARQSLAVADRLDDENTRAHVWLALAELELVADHPAEADRLLTLAGTACMRLGYALLGAQVELMRVLVEIWRGELKVAADGLLRLMCLPEWPSNPNDLVLASLWLLLRAGDMPSVRGGLELCPQLSVPGDYAPLSNLVQAELLAALPAAAGGLAGQQGNARDPVAPGNAAKLRALLVAALQRVTGNG